MPKSILISLTYYYPNISGLSQYAKILAEELVKRGSEVTILCGNHQRKLSESEYVNGVKIVRLKAIRARKGLIIPSIFWKSINLVKNTEIVNCHFPSIEGVWVAILAKVFRKKLIVTYHCHYNRVAEWWQYLAYVLADKIVVNSIDYIEGNNLLKSFRKKIAEIWPPIQIPLPAKAGHLPLMKGRNTKSKNVVGFLGRISREKNIEVLIEAMKKLPDWKLWLAGPESILGEEKYQKKIETMIGGNRNIKRLGVVENISDFYRQISCLVLPSNNTLESFGMVLAEAIKSGTPVVASDLPGIRVPIRESGFGELFDPNNVDDLVKKIKIATTKKYPKIQNTMFNFMKTVDAYKKVFEGK
jgi:glycosyltransferase involved in cell wall biosynthesis